MEMQLSKALIRLVSSRACVPLRQGAPGDSSIGAALFLFPLFLQRNCKKTHIYDKSYRIFPAIVNGGLRIAP
jgi:hypothetical protein